MSYKLNNKNIKDRTAPFESGLNRRAFLKQSGVASLLTGFLVTKPAIAMSFFQDEKATNNSNLEKFSKTQKETIAAVQLQLFPADGDGPSSVEINALPYLEWALTDPKNREDGDRAFIASGVDWLHDFSKETMRKSFTQLSSKQQHSLLTQFSKTKKHENWMSILVYYLIEALLLDPVYGGNPDGVGWKWLEHQPGYPRPNKSQIFSEFD